MTRVRADEWIEFAGVGWAGGVYSKEVESRFEDLWAIYGVNLVPKAVGSH